MLGGNVDIVRFLISLFSSEEGLRLLSALLGGFSENKQTDDDEDDPEIEKLFEEITQKNKPSSKLIEEGYALAPISSLANKDIIYMLNGYFASF